MAKRTTTTDRALSVLSLFTADQPEWTVEAIRSKLHLSVTTAYQYVGSLIHAGLLVSVRGGRYSIGPAAIELDRIARKVDPLTRDARAVLVRLVEECGEKAVGLLCRLYKLRVMCVDQYVMEPPEIESSYERGRPMPLIHGAASKVILANLPPRELRRFYDREAVTLNAAGLGHDWETFKDEMRRIRRGGPLTVTGELDTGAMGIAAPVFGDDDNVVGSISIVLAEARVHSDPAQLQRLRNLVNIAGLAVTEALRVDAAASNGGK